MKKYLSFLAVSAFFLTVLMSSNLHHDHYKNYIYDSDGVRLFVKVYVEDTELLSHSRQESKTLLKFLQRDNRGSFLPVPITKKRNANDDQEDYWICPICGIKNPESAQFCTNSECPLYRKGWRDW